MSENQLDQGGLKRFEDILETAIQREKDAYEFYIAAAGKVKDIGARVLLKELAEEELEHVRLLEEKNDEEEFKASDIDKSALIDMKLSNFMIDKGIEEHSTPQDIFVIAIKAEERAQQFYQKSGENTQNTSLKDIFKKFASFELKHKKILEEEYEKVYLKEF